MIINCPYKNKCNGKDCDKDFCIRKYKLDTLYSNSLLADNYKARKPLVCDDNGTDYEEFVKLAEIERDIKDFVNQGKNLYIHSATPGNGKTSWSVRLIQAYFDAIWAKTDLTCRALFISVPRFLLALKENISKKSEYISFIQDNILTADLVIWDDIAAKVGSEFEVNHLLSLIDNRIAQNKCNIFTSNLDRDHMYDALGERIASRICNMSIEIEFHGKDKRFLVEQGGNE